ncbi:GDSL-like Lipase/Acylhydrolase superfamily protein, partial [Striga asiatica]
MNKMLLIIPILIASMLQIPLNIAKYSHVLHALYVLGDSLFDSENNNLLPTLAKVDFSPYGMNFNGGRPTGRFTNRRTVVDFIVGLFERIVKEEFPKHFTNSTELSNYLAKSIFLKLYRLGARKVIMFEIGQSGAFPPRRGVKWWLMAVKMGGWFNGLKYAKDRVIKPKFGILITWAETLGLGL